MEKILIVEDEDVIRTALKRLLEHNGYQVSEANSVQQAETRHDLADFQLIISDLRLPGAPGTDLIQKAEDVPVLIMTSYASLRSAVDSMRIGAVDYIAKPFNHDEMLDKVQHIIRTHSRSEGEQRQSPRNRKRGQPQLGAMIGSCKPMLRLYDYIAKVAPTDTTVLIRGETGTGKELVAQSIHNESHRADQPLICVN